MKYIYVLFIMTITLTTSSASQVSKKECEKVWAEGEIIHDFDELEVIGGNYRPRSYIRYKGSIYYGILSVASGPGKDPNIWVDLNCWNSNETK